MRNNLTGWDEQKLAHKTPADNACEATNTIRVSVYGKSTILSSKANSAGPSSSFDTEPHTKNRAVDARCMNIF